MPEGVRQGQGQVQTQRVCLPEWALPADAEGLGVDAAPLLPPPPPPLPLDDLPTLALGYLRLMVCHLFLQSFSDLGATRANADTHMDTHTHASGKATDQMATPQPQHRTRTRQGDRHREGGPAHAASTHGMLSSTG